ncbi:MAG: hypothetical protein WCP45_07590 [Verrucomicrobiota bacterium]
MIQCLAANVRAHFFILHIGELLAVNPQHRRREAWLHEGAPC